MNLALALFLLTSTVQGDTTRHWQLSLGLGGAHQLTHSLASAIDTRMSGSRLSGEARVAYGGLAGRLRYGQGRVTNGAAARDLVEGEALVGYRIRPWLGVFVGPHARTFVVTGLSDRRWLSWSGHVMARGNLFPERVASVVELWQSFSGRLSRPLAPASSHGMEAGLELRLPAGWWGGLGYRFEQSRVANGPRETFEAFTLTLGYRLR